MWLQSKQRPALYRNRVAQNRSEMIPSRTSSRELLPRQKRSKLRAKIGQLTEQAVPKFFFILEFILSTGSSSSS